MLFSDEIIYVLKVRLYHLKMEEQCVCGFFNPQLISNYKFLFHLFPDYTKIKQCETLYTKQYLKLLIEKLRLELQVMAKSALQYLTDCDM